MLTIGHNRTKTIVATTAVLLALFGLTVTVSLHVPMHSDDFAYSLQGMSLKNHWQHYLNWSGRVVADYTSSAILSCSSRNLRNIINSSALIISIFLVVLLASQLTRTKIAPVIFIFIYMIYWLSNPNLGQTTFWIVGSANYLWTNFYILIFFELFLLYI